MMVATSFQTEFPRSASEHPNVKSNLLHWLTISGTVKRLKLYEKSIIKEAFNDGQGTAKTMERPATA